MPAATTSSPDRTEPTTMPLPRFLLAAVLLSATWSGRAAATPSYDGCTGFLEPVGNAGSTTLLQGITGPGVWCLKRDVLHDNVQTPVYALLSFGMDDITIDCRGHRLVATNGGPPGIQVSGFARIAVRNCRLKGFYPSISIQDGQVLGASREHVVEGNEIHGGGLGIIVGGHGSVVRDNRLFDTRGIAINVTGRVDVLDNVIDGVTGEAPRGIFAGGSGGNEIRGNLVRELHTSGNPAVGIESAMDWSNFDAHERLSIRDNTIVGEGHFGTTGIQCQDPSGTVTYGDNLLVAKAGVGGHCIDAGDNDYSE
jgi:hypothetical protein